ncbi:hypothetical protein BCR34DRAFT_553550 [Clohesyomyces aquaticus]|uniref:Uncharacterized protein n=1 Tax=Clohesyomyces aquaticus TaxID=1231657 RepID=A0A1Y2A8G2_9PLEO|nr:hypothetical protein BCR34DRAFT_553550 [Clohesyomyces aquaticus]
MPPTLGAVLNSLETTCQSSIDSATALAETTYDAADVFYRNPGRESRKLAKRSVDRVKVWLVAHPKETRGFVVRYATPVLGALVLGPVVGGLGGEFAGQSVVWLATAFARFRTRQFLAGNYFALLHTAGLSSLWGQLAAMGAPVGLPVLGGLPGQVFHSYIFSLAVSTGGLQAPLLGLGLSFITNAASWLGLIPGLLLKGQGMTTLGRSVAVAKGSSVRALFGELGSLMVFKSFQWMLISLNKAWSEWMESLRATMGGAIEWIWVADKSEVGEEEMEKFGEKGVEMQMISWTNDSGDTNLREEAAQPKGGYGLMYLVDGAKKMVIGRWWTEKEQTQKVHLKDWPLQKRDGGDDLHQHQETQRNVWNIMESDDEQDNDWELVDEGQYLEPAQHNQEEANIWGIVDPDKEPDDIPDDEYTIIEPYNIKHSGPFLLDVGGWWGTKKQTDTEDWDMWGKLHHQSQDDNRVPDRDVNIWGMTNQDTKEEGRVPEWVFLEIRKLDLVGDLPWDEKEALVWT